MEHPATSATEDPARLALLRRLRLLEEAPSEAFDRLTRIAVRALGVPVSLVCLVDRDRQVLAGCCGPAGRWASRRETPLSHSFCRHVVDGGEPLVVADAREDPRVRDNPAIGEMGVVAYAGVPLRAAGGEVLGAVCAIDQEPRRWTAEQLALLHDLAATAATEIELRAEIASRREAEAALREGETRYRALFDRSPLACVLVDPASLRFVEFNDEAHRQLGYDAESFARLRVSDVSARSDAELRETVEEVVRGGWTRFDTVHLRRDGGELTVQVTAQRVEVGGRAYVLSVWQDVTERVRALRERERLLAELKGERNRLREVLMHAPVPMSVSVGPEHRIQSANEAYRELVGGRRLVGLTVRDAFPELVEQGFLDILDRVYRTGEPFVGRELRARWGRGDGEARQGFVDLMYQPLRGPDGQVEALLTLALDVTEQVEARRAVEAASQAKSDFMAVMSHELRTPLTAVIGYSELLELGIPVALPDELRDHVRRIHLSSHHLLQIIEEILAYTRMEAGRERPDPQSFDPGELVQEVAAIAGQLAEARGLRFRTRCEELPDTLHTDPRKLRQILLNLTGNAVKFTPEGEVELSVRGRGEMVELAVRDTGIGIADEHLERLYEPFWQADSSLTRSAGGTGLGLAITRRFVEMLGGTIDVRSAPGEGSVFTVVLPAHVPADDSWVERRG